MYGDDDGKLSAMRDTASGLPASRDSLRSLNVLHFSMSEMVRPSDKHCSVLETALGCGFAKLVSHYQWAS